MNSAGRWTAALAVACLLALQVSAQEIPQAKPEEVGMSGERLAKVTSTVQKMVDDKKITWIIEASGGIRWIWMDGRAHPPIDELRLTANGHSVGSWEEDVLVIDSVGFMNKAMVYMNMPGNISIYPSPQMRFVERLRLVEDGQAIVINRTLSDPVNLQEPWETTVRYERRDWELGETICMENNDLNFYFESGDLPGEYNHKQGTEGQVE